MVAALGCERKEPAKTPPEPASAAQPGTLLLTYDYTVTRGRQLQAPPSQGEVDVSEPSLAHLRAIVAASRTFSDFDPGSLGITRERFEAERPRILQSVAESSGYALADVTAAL